MRLWKFADKILICLLVSVLMLLLLPLRWLCSALIAAGIHELGHYTGVCLMGGKVSGMRVGTTGAVMKACGLTQGEELVCLIAGPLAGLLLGLTFRWCPLIAICGIFQSVYNLLPIYPLDGGRILRCFASMLGYGSRFCKTIEYGVFFILFALLIYLKIRLEIVVSILLYFGILLLRKIPCKQG